MYEALLRDQADPAPRCMPAWDARMGSNARRVVAGESCPADTYRETSSAFPALSIMLSRL